MNNNVIIKKQQSICLKVKIFSISLLWKVNFHKNKGASPNLIF